MKTQNQIYQKQLAQTIAYLLGEAFGNQKPMLSATALN
jgi:hypothetical protein